LEKTPWKHLETGFTHLGQFFCLPVNDGQVFHAVPEKSPGVPMLETSVMAGEVFVFFYRKPMGEIPILYLFHGILDFPTKIHGKSYKFN